MIRRKRAGWYSFSTLRDVFGNRNVSALVKAHLFDANVLPFIAYACETWCLIKKEERFLQVIQRSMERRITNVQLVKHISNKEVRRSKVTDILETVYTARRRWTGHDRHVIRREDGRWTTRITEWSLKLYETKRQTTHQME